MTRQSTRRVQVPGAKPAAKSPVAAQATPQAEALTTSPVAALTTEQVGVGALAGTGTAAMQPDELEEALANAQAAAAASAAPAPAPAPVAEVQRPDGKPTLTDKGWIVPREYAPTRRGE